MTMKKLLALLIAVLLAGCAAVVKVEGDQVLNNKLAVKLPDAWNKLNYPGQPYEVWTQEGASLDQLRFWAGIQPGKQIMTAPPSPWGRRLRACPPLPPI